MPLYYDVFSGVPVFILFPWRASFKNHGARDIPGENRRRKGQDKLPEKMPQKIAGDNAGEIGGENAAEIPGENDQRKEQETSASLHVVGTADYIAGFLAPVLQNVLSLPLFLTNDPCFPRFPRKKRKDVGHPTKWAIAFYTQ